MAIIKCKMCGGDLLITEGMTVCECEYCGSNQTVSVVDDEKMLKLYERANRLRMANEFDKAASVYENIISEIDTEAEAYWGLVLCKYGIEYVDDPSSGDKIPTCHRSSFDSVMDDSDFELVMENADTLSRIVYREQAKQIEEIRKGIIEVSGKEQPYDIFICYKETAEDGQRTIDSVIAQDVYDALTDKGYRVFFSRITLEDKLGQEYEPYIFAALNSAKVMLAFGSTYDYFNAVWVKNEWSRFLKFMAKDKEKHLIPCYKDIDAYDMPREFKHLQAQDMGKVGAVQDLLRGIVKILGDKQIKEIEKLSINQVALANNNALIKRGNMALEDMDWDKAEEFFEEVLNKDAECAEAYLGKWLKSLGCSRLSEVIEYVKEIIDESNPEEDDFKLLYACQANEEHISSVVKEYSVRGFLEEIEIKKLFDFDRSYMSEVAFREGVRDSILDMINSEKSYNRVNQYATGNLASELIQTITTINEILKKYVSYAMEEDEANIESITNAYNEHVASMEDKAKSLHDFAIEKRESTYLSRVKAFNDAKEMQEFERSKENFLKLYSYKDSQEYIDKCDDAIKRILDKKTAEEARQKEIYDNALKSEANKKKIIVVVVALLVLGTGIGSYIYKYNVKLKTYQSAQMKVDEKQIKEAIDMFEEVKDFKDTSTILQQLYYEYGIELLDKEEYSKALSYFNASKGKYRNEYIKYCELVLLINDIPDDTTLDSIVSKVVTLHNFNNADLLYEKIPKYDLIKSRMGVWWKYTGDTWKHNHTRIEENFTCHIFLYENGKVYDEYYDDIYWEYNRWNGGVEDDLLNEVSMEYIKDGGMPEAY